MFLLPKEFGAAIKDEIINFLKIRSLFLRIELWFE